MVSVLAFFLFVEIIHFVTIPIAWRLFRSENDRGYGVGKILGIIIISYFSWLLPSLKLLSYSRFTIFLMLVCVAAVSALIYTKNKLALRDFFVKNRKGIITVEALFAVSFFFFIMIRLFNPEISYDVNLYAAEKFPDMAYFHSIIRYDQLPPADLWFSGPENYINYYYYGYFVQATVAKLAGVDPWIAYNLALALIFGLSVVGAYSLLYNLTGERRIGLLAAIMLCVMGNLYGVTQMATGQPFGPLEIWHGSRVVVKKEMVNNTEKIIDSTINEFPMFSFLLGDLHAHLLALPLSLLVLHFLVFFYHVRKPIWRFIMEDRAAPWMLLLFLISFGSLISGNYWDLPTYTLLSALVFLLSALSAPKADETAIVPKAMEISQRVETFGDEAVVVQRKVLSISLLTDRIKRISNSSKATSLLMHILGWEIMMGLVFMLSGGAIALKSAGGEGIIGKVIGIVSAPFQYISPFGQFFKHYAAPPAKVALVPSDQHSQFGQFMTIHGFFYFLAIVFSVLLLYRIIRKSKEQGIIIAAVPIAVFLLTFLIWKELTISFLAGIIIFTSLLMTHTRTPEKPRLILGLIAMASAVLLGCEFIYIKDFYGHPNERMNTVFKFYYEAWIFLSLAGAYIYYHISSLNSKKIIQNIPFQLATLIFLIASFVYPVKAVPIKADNFKPIMGRPTLNGFAYIKERYTGDYEAIEWIRQNIQGNPVILEATGNPYSYHGRVSTMTGLPTVLGWGNHESLWRDWSWKIVGERSNDVRTLYKSLNVQEAGNLIKKYAVSYIFIGSLENEEFYSYDQNGLAKFRNFCDVVYEKKDVLIFKVKADLPVEQYPAYQRDTKLIIPKERGKVVVNEKGMKTIEGRQSIALWGAKGSADGQFNDPKAIALDSKGNIYISDTQNHRIQVLDPNGQFIRAIGSGKGEVPGQFNTPIGLAIDTQDNLYVADTWNHRIQKFDPDGKLLKSWGDPGMFWAPKELVFDDKGFLYVVDTGFHRIHKFDAEGKELKVWGEKGDDPGKFTEPVGIEFSNGTIYVADTANQRISLFDTEGQFKANWYVIGWEEFYSEPFLAIDPVNNVLAATDSRHNRIEFFALSGDNAGTLIAVWESAGNGPGQFNWPLGLAFTPDGHFLVVDSLNARIQKFAPFEKEFLQTP